MLANDEIRNLKEGSLYNVAQILDTDEDWKKFMSLIPKDPLGQNFIPKYNNEHVRLIEEHSKKTGEKCAKILFDEWGTSGRIRPTLRTIMDIASKADMLRVTDEIARILGVTPPPRPQTGPGAPVDTSITSLLNESELQAQPTAQMKSVSDMIKFSTQYHCDGPTAQMQSESTALKFPAQYHSKEPTTQMHFKTTAQIKSESDLIKFSKLYQCYEPTAPMKSESNNQINIQSASTQNSHSTTATEDFDSLPAFSQLMVSPYKTDQSEENGNSASVSSYQEETNTASVSSFPEESNINISRYQESLPNIELLHQETGQNLNISNRIDQSILQDSNLINFNYEELKDITSNFSETVHDGPHGLIGKIGQGGYGEVFAGSHPNYGLLAIKRIHLRFVPLDEAVNTFNTEVKLLSQLRHENIVPIIGFCKDDPLCIICNYVDGGSLDKKLQERVLSEKQRINIMQGTAEGLQYIHSIKLNSQSFNSSSSGLSGHSASKTHLMHGDVKSANILLTKDFVPKLCDFGLAKQYGVTSYTLNPKGTRAYMAPEGFTGTVTQKSDVYSYGIVLLELLTGLHSIIFMDYGEIDIKSYINEALMKNGNTFSDLLDTSAGVWTKANEIYSLTCKCLKDERPKRPSMDEICEILHGINK